MLFLHVFIAIESLRYDKRGCGKSSGDYYSATHLTLVNDSIACFDFLKNSETCIANQIYVLGHSEGSIIAPQMSIKRSSIAGIILLCPFIQNMETILVMQARHIQEAIVSLKGINAVIYKVLLQLTGNPVALQRKLINKLKSSSEPTFRHWFTKIPAAQLRDLLKIAPQDIFRQVKCPTLLIGGEKDIQCDPADVGRIAELVRGTVNAHVIDNLTHILRTDEHTPSIFRYAELIKKPVEPAVIDLATQWLRQNICALG